MFQQFISSWCWSYQGKHMEALRDSTVNNAWLSVSLFRVQPFNPFTQMSSTITMPIGG